MGFPLGALIWGGIGTFALVRTFWNPQRSLVKDGYAYRCAGTVNCNPDMVLESFAGKAAVYSVVTGPVLSSGGGAIEIASEVEPVILRYAGDASYGSMESMVKVGERVRTGQLIGYASRLSFAVRRAERLGDGKIVWVAIEPASWLAARGLSISVKKHPPGAGAWCEGGRALKVPQTVANCNIKLPQPGAWMLLPVSATME